MICSLCQRGDPCTANERLTANAPPSPTLCAQFSNRVAASTAFNMLFPKGTWHGANFEALGGSITIDDAMLEEMVANWKAAGSPQLPVYKTHAHLDPKATPSERAELSKAYGYLTDLRVTAEGLEAKTEWTAAGKAMVDAGEFAFWSPEWQPRHRDRRTGDLKGWWLSGTALCSDPFFNEMPPVAASHEMGGGVSEAIKWLKAAIARHERHMSGAEPTSDASQMQMMDEMKRALAVLDELPMVAANQGTTKSTPQYRSNPMNEEQLKLLRAALGLSTTATVDECLKAASKAGTDVTTLTAEVTKLKGDAPNVKALVAEAVKAAVEPMQVQLKVAEEKALSLEVDQLIATAKAGDGKNGRAIADTVKPVLLKLVATEAKREDGLKAAKDYLDAIPLTVPVVAIGTTGTTEPLTASAASEKLKAEAEKLQKDGNITPWLSAVARNPELARIAQEGK